MNNNNTEKQELLFMKLHFYISINSSYLIKKLSKAYPRREFEDHLGYGPKNVNNSTNTNFTLFHALALNLFMIHNKPKTSKPRFLLKDYLHEPQMESDNLRTASSYINNLLLSRGLLRNGQTIDFSRPDKGDGGIEGTMGRVMSLVNDLILRRDVSTAAIPGVAVHTEIRFPA